MSYVAPALPEPVAETAEVVEARLQHAQAVADLAVAQPVAEAVVVAKTAPEPVVAPVAKQAVIVEADPKAEPIQIAPAPVAPVVVPAAVSPGAAPAVISVGLPSLTSTQHHAQDEYGQYTYGYNNEDSSKVETKTADGIVRGSYSYIDADGETAIILDH